MARKFMDRLKRSKAFNLFLALMLTVSTLPVQAFAAESADVQSRMSGTCYVQCVRSAWDGGTLFKAPEKEPPVYHTGGSSVLWRIFRQKRPAVYQRAAFL